MSRAFLGNREISAPPQDGPSLRAGTGGRPVRGAPRPLGEGLPWAGRSREEGPSLGGLSRGGKFAWGRARGEAAGRAVHEERPALRAPPVGGRAALQGLSARGRAFLRRGCPRGGKFAWGKARGKATGRPFVGREVRVGKGPRRNGGQAVRRERPPYAPCPRGEGPSLGVPFAGREVRVGKGPRRSGVAHSRRLCSGRPWVRAVTTGWADSMRRIARARPWYRGQTEEA